MATDAATNQSRGIANMAVGSFTGDGTLTAVNCGFRPRYVKLINLTDRIVSEITSDMAATQTLNTAAVGTMTLDTGSDIVLKGGPSDTYRGFEVSAATAIAAKAFHYIAYG